MESTENTSSTQTELVSPPLTPKKKAGRKPKKAKAAEPAAPSATVLALEGEILHFVAMRSRANGAMREARLAAENAQVQLRMAQEQLMEVEREVNYRMGLISQLKGGSGVPQLNAPNFSSGYANAPSFTGGALAAESYSPHVGVPAGVGSVVSMPHPENVAFDGGRKVRSESAEGFRAML